MRTRPKSRARHCEFTRRSDIRYIQRKAEQEAEAAEAKAAKDAKVAENRKAEEMVFGGAL